MWPLCECGTTISYAPSLVGRQMAMAEGPSLLVVAEVNGSEPETVSVSYLMVRSGLLDASRWRKPALWVT